MTPESLAADALAALRVNVLGLIEMARREERDKARDRAYVAVLAERERCRQIALGVEADCITDDGRHVAGKIARRIAAQRTPVEEAIG